ncbi:MAG: Calx-beta domain-containing protein [Actinomycetota bacterium]
MTIAILTAGLTPAGAANGPVGNGWIAFTSERDGGVGHIWRMNADGSGLTQLTSGETVVDHAAWSPDGTRIAFTSYPQPAADGEVFVMNADGSGQTNLTKESSSDEFEPAWSPDGSKVAFGSNRDGNQEIYVMNADGSGQTNLTETTEHEGGPSWSPDGSSIAYLSLQGGSNFEIFSMNQSGSGQSNLTEHAAFDTNPAWSPDGSRIAFSSNRDGMFEIHVMDTNGDGQAKIPGVGYGDDPAWAPDGSRITFTSRPSDNYEVSVVAADGSGLANLTNHPSDDDYRPSWQPVPVPSISVSKPKSKEGKRERFRITLAAPPVGPLTLSFETAKGTAKPRKDFKPTEGTLDFGPGVDSAVVKVKTRGDPRDERKETFFLDLTGPGGASARGKARIKDDD